LELFFGQMADHALFFVRMRLRERVQRMADDATLFQSDAIFALFQQLIKGQMILIARYVFAEFFSRAQE